MGDIAIIGLACRYPDANSPAELWENVLAQRRAFRRLPAERLRREDYFSADPAAPDRTYAMQAAVLEGFEFDRVKFKVAGPAFRSADLAHWLALDVAAQALTDAGFPNGAGLPRESTGVVLGNTLTGEFSRANVLRLRWPYVRRVVDAALSRQDWSTEQRRDFLERLEAQYKSPFPPVDEETLAGGLSNTIAGRICNQFDLQGGGYTVDGACSSSLLAVSNACTALATGDLDVALAGGVDLSLDPFELVGFAKTGALAPREMRIYDERSAGFWPGEGCGFVTLMRHADAVAEGRRIYATIRGWGVSSDGAGGLTRPEVEGQLQALRRAYRRAGYGIDSVSFFEGHGTGTNVGDATELKALSRARRETRGDAPPAFIGSIKANIGHTKAAAGIAGVIKATLALHSQIIPPTTGCEIPHAELRGHAPALRIAPEPTPWPADEPLRAGVSAMGFGGINSHLTLEGGAVQRRQRLNVRERTLASSAQDAEIFLLGAADAAGLQEQVDRLLAFAARLSRSELADLAATLARELASKRVRAAVVAATPEELVARLETLRAMLTDPGAERVNPDVFVGAGDDVPRIGFLFPGQGSPANLTGGLYRRRFDFARELYNRANLPTDADGIATQIAQPALCVGSLAGLQALAQLGIAAEVGVGHSLGEITALHWAGAFDAEALCRIAAARGRAMSGLPGVTGGMAAIAAPAGEVKVLLNGDPISIVGYNSPRQTVVAGAAEKVAAFVERAQAGGLRCTSLPVSHAFHTPLVADAAPLLGEALRREMVRPLQRKVISTVTGAPLHADEDLHELLCRQVTVPVRFTDALRAAGEVDLWIEVGPGEVLGGLVSQCHEQVRVISLDAGGASLRGWLRAAGGAFALGAPLKVDALFAGRFTRPFNLDWRPKFFVNPCELAPLPDAGMDGDSAPVQSKPAPSVTMELAAVAISPAPAAALEVVRQLVAQRVELPVASIRDDSRMLSELHLNSITVGQLVAEAARALGLPPLTTVMEFADASVREISEALAAIARTGRPDAEESRRSPDGVDAWVRCFTVDWVKRPRAIRKISTSAGRWQMFAPPGHRLATELKTLLASAAGEGVVVCLPESAEDGWVKRLLDGVHAVLAEKRPARFVLVQDKFTAAGIARTLHQEAPGISTCVVTVPFDHPQAARWVCDEALAATGHGEARYESDGARSEPEWRFFSAREQSDETKAEVAATGLSADDVWLVTGGGKGIAAECALELVRRYGTRLALVGRSAPEDDAELAANLERFAALGARFGYYRADVTDAGSVRRAVEAAERELGPVTAVLHGAGANEPKLLSGLDEAAFERTLRPKIDGLRHVLAAVPAERLLRLVTFGSIIARAGLPGEGDYAVANEWLVQLTEDFQREHPQCRCLAMEWSVWSGVGMGQRLGRIEALRQQGITPIPPDEGVAWFCRLLENDVPSTAVVVTGRFGEPPTVRLEKQELPLLRFLERPRVYYPGIELVVDSEISVESDPYLADHMLHGERLFPAVMGLEAMAQAAMAVTGAADPPGFGDVQLHRPVVAPRSGKTTIRVAALVRAPGVVEVALRTEATGFRVDHFRALCRFETSPLAVRSAAAHFESAAASLESVIEAGRSAPPARVNFPTKPLALDSARDLYAELLFHTGRFQRVKNYRVLRARECVVEVEPDGDAVWFGEYLPPQRVLGDAGVRDAAIHAIQACIPHARLLPVSVRAITLGKLPCLEERIRAGGPRPTLLLHAREQSRTGDTFDYDLELLGEDGTVLEKWEGLVLRKVEELPHSTPWAEALLGPYVERRLEELAGAKLVAEFHRSEDTSRPARSEQAVRQLLGDAVTLRHRPDGKPEVDGGQSVSLAHAGELTLAVAACGSLGCDLESVTERSTGAWRGMLGTDRFALAEVLARELSEDFNASATRVWTAMEGLKKAGAPANTPLLLTKTSPDGWLMLSAGGLVVASFVASVREVSEPVALAIVTRATPG